LDLGLVVVGWEGIGEVTVRRDEMSVCNVGI
jgi:hypothetical protein